MEVTIINSAFVADSPLSPACACIPTRVQACVSTLCLQPGLLSWFRANSELQPWVWGFARWGGLLSFGRFGPVLSQAPVSDNPSHKCSHIAYLSQKHLICLPSVLLTQWKVVTVWVSLSLPRWGRFHCAAPKAPDERRWYDSILLEGIKPLHLLSLRA